MAENTDQLNAALTGRYVIEHELGAGGMATVYLAHDVKHERQVALKVLRPELAATLGPERFTREIKIAARLQHPHILPLHDSGEADGFLYYVMPYVEGESLRDRLTRSGELPIDDAVRIIREMVDALAHGIVRMASIRARSLRCALAEESLAGHARSVRQRRTVATAV